jgi:hypothetical protein
MPPPRHYGALRDTEREYWEGPTEPVPVRPGPALILKPDAEFLAQHELSTQKVAYADALQAQVKRGDIDRGEKDSLMSRFDRGDPDIRREAREICEARELAAAARADEAAERGKAHELDGLER